MIQPKAPGDISAIKKCIIYARFSPRPDAANSDSAEVQVATCEEFAFKRGWEILGHFSDLAVSGAADLASRDGLTAAIDSIKKGGDCALLVMKRDRIARDLMVGLQIERVVESHGGIVVCAQGEPFGTDPNAVMMKQMLMVIAEWERKIISERTRTALRAKMRAGKKVGGRGTPYGWRVDPKDSRGIVPDLMEQATLRKIVKLRKGGMTLLEIAAVLDPATDRSGKWHPEKIRRALKRMEYLPLPDIPDLE